MDSTLLRILLIILGIALILSIYLWERMKSRRVRSKAIGDRADKDNDFSDNKDDLLMQDQEALSRYLDELEAIVRKEESSAERKLGEEAAIEQNAQDEPEAPGEPQTILTLSVVSRRKFFSGDAIMSAMRSAGLEPGPRNIFYRYTPGEKRILYGIASMVEPGVFPLKNMSRFTTSGITLFASLPGEQSGQQILDDMISTAERLAAFLDGLIHDAHHQLMTDETLDAMRELASGFAAKQD